MDPKLPNAVICIPNKNYGHFIKDALNSAIMQDYPNKVVHIVDDCSTDNSVEVINSMLQNDGQVVKNNDDYELRMIPTQICPVFLFKLKKSGGPSRARNFSIKWAFENNIHIWANLDSDDIMLNTKLSKCTMEIIKNMEAIGGCYADYLHLNSESGVISYEHKWSYDLNKLRRESIVHSGAVYNILALKQFGLYPEDQRTCEEFKMNRQIARKFLFIKLAEPLTIVRVQPQNSTLTVDKKVWEEDYMKAMMVQI